MTELVSERRRVLALAAGDLLVVAAVVGWGTVDHNGIAALFDARTVAATVGPFLLGYALVAVLAGAYNRGRRVRLAWSLRTVLATWLGGACLGLVVRTSPVVAGGVTWPFGLVVTGTVGVGLFLWRALAHVVAERIDPDDPLA